MGNKWIYLSTTGGPISDSNTQFAVIGNSTSVFNSRDSKAYLN